MRRTGEAWMRDVVTLTVAVVLASGMAMARAEAQAARPATCSTFNASSEPASAFAPGEKITVRGTGFGPRSVVLVSYQQDTRTVELARSTANDLGAFRADAAQIPDTVVNGTASIRALDARGSATCNITIKGAAKDAESDLGVLYVVWGVILAVFGLFLAAVTYRRWKAQRLREAMEGFGVQSLPELLPDEDDVEPSPSVVPAARSMRRRRTGTRLPDASEIDGDSFDEEWAFREHVPAGWVRERTRARLGGGTDVLHNHAWESADDVDDDEAVWRRPPEHDAIEPPRLPDDWDDGRVRGERRPSEAIERLRREVRSWKKE